MRKSTIFLTYITVNIALLVAMFAHAAREREAAVPLLRNMAETVGRYGLTDICLFTDARYTRHPSMADLHTPFQDYPMSFEHFPSGSLVLPPRHLKESPSGRDKESASDYNLSQNCVSGHTRFSLSFPRSLSPQAVGGERESRISGLFWMPVSTGMTFFSGNIDLGMGSGVSGKESL